MQLWLLDTIKVLLGPTTSMLAGSAAAVMVLAPWSLLLPCHASHQNLLYEPPARLV